MTSSVIRPKHRFSTGGVPHIWDVTGDGRWEPRFKDHNKKLFKKVMRRQYKKIKIEEE